MKFQIEYTSRRREVRAWYWREWRRNLWKNQLLMGLAVGTAVFIVRWDNMVGVSQQLALAGLAGILSVSWMPLFPMLMFKPQRRAMSVDGNGIETTIGKRSGSRTWREIQTISDDGENVILKVTNGNAFIVPRRAFDSAETRAQFVDFATRLLRASENAEQ